MRADRIDHCSLLADEQVAGAMEHQATLLLARLGCDEAHVCPGDRFADCLGVSGIVLLPLDVGLHVGRWHQAHPMPKRLELARPMMRRCTGLDANETRRQLLEKRQNVAALQLTAYGHIAFRVDAMDLKNRLCDVETNCRDRLHAWLLRIRSPHRRPLPWHLRAGGGAVHSINNGHWSATPASGRAGQR